MEPGDRPRPGGKLRPGERAGAQDGEQAGPAERAGLEQDEGKFVLGLISRLTNQKGLDLVSAVIPQVLDGNTQIVVLGTGDKVYEDTFRGYEDAYKGTFSACIQYDESRAHRIYAGADALLVPSRFEPCGA